MKKIVALLCGLVLMLTLTACGGDDAPDAQGKTRTVTSSAGQAYEIPVEVTKIVGATPAATEIITGLGEGDKLVAIDNYSVDVEGVDKELPTFDTLAPDIELLMSLEPEVLIASSNSLLSDSDPYKTLADQGCVVIYMDNSVSLEGIMADISFVADIAGNTEKGAAMVEDIQTKMEAITATASGITDKKSVYFEISPAPDLCTIGTGNFLDEIINLVGATNCYGDKEGWITPNEEEIIAKNPDVILTNVDYSGDQVKAINERSGWKDLTAVASGAVFMVEANATSRPTQNIVKAMDQIAKAVYPDLY